MDKRIRIGIDVGGTFTDFVLVDEITDRIHTGKLLTTPGDPSDAIIEGTARLLDVHPDIDVIVASSDTLAHGVLIEAAARGLQVPQQLAVIGFGDQNFAAHVHPPLSTVRVDGEMIGTLAAKAILQRLNPQDDNKVPAVTDTGFQLIHRAST